MIELSLKYLNLILAIALMIWVALLLVQKKVSALKYYIAVFNLSMVYVLLYHWSLRSGAIIHVPGLIHSDIPVSFAIGPVVYLYMVRLLGVDRQFKLSHLSHFIPVFLSAFLLVIHHYLQNPFMEYQPISRPMAQDPGGTLMYILDIASDIWVSLYLLLSARKVRLSINAGRFKNIKELRLIFYLLVIVAVSYWAVWFSHYINNHVMLAIFSIINGTSILGCVLFSHRYAELTQTVIKEPKPARKPESLLLGIDIEEITGRLTELIERDKVYRDPGITLQSLSTMIETNASRLSLILNERMKMNFRTFINYYRLKEAMDLLADDDNKTILEIAFSVGFNSKTSFNTLFFKETGLTPREYRKKYLKKYVQLS